MLTAIVVSVAAYFVIGFIQSTIEKGKRRQALDSEARAARARAVATEPSRDPHQILGVARGASAADIQAAYKKLAADYHPDKVSGSAKEIRELAERRLREINVAYEALTKSR